MLPVQPVTQILVPCLGFYRVNRLCIFQSRNHVFALNKDMLFGRNVNVSRNVKRMRHLAI